MATHLKRSLNLPVLTLYGLGNILGAGIYVLIGKVAGFAGQSTTLAFILAMIIAALTAFSYMELAGRYPVSASVSVYLHKAFGNKNLSVAIGLAMVAGGITSAAALAHGFAGYLNTFFNFPELLASILLLLSLGLIALKGINESAKTAAAFTFVEILGLVLVVWFGRSAFAQVQPLSLVNIDSTVGISGLLAGAFLAFYAFIGFEDMVNVAEEAKNPKKSMPLAILFSLIISTLLYVLVVIVSTTIVAPAELAQSSAPLTLVFSKSGVSSQQILSLIGLVAAINGVIVQIIMGSRILYGLSKQGWISAKLSELHAKRQTPTKSTLLILSLMIFFTIILPIVSLAQITSLLVLTIFSAVNISLIFIKKSHKKHDGYITVPLLVPILGSMLCLAAIIYQILDWLLKF